MRFRYALFLIVFVLASSPTASAQSGQSGIGIGSLLREDGTLDLNCAAGSIDVTGWQMGISESGPPVFSKTVHEAGVGDEFWQEGYGNPIIEDRVNALVVDGSGNLYAGGEFTSAGGISANRVARWDGSGWSSLGSGMNDQVLALAAFWLPGSLWAALC